MGLAGMCAEWALLPAGVTVLRRQSSFFFSPRPEIPRMIRRPTTLTATLPPMPPFAA
jgi:hypothetical protein